MPQDDFRIFLSAVNSEFRRARDLAVAADLRSRGLPVKVESDFRQESDSDTILRKLHNYICDCSAVVCILGERSGSWPAPAEAAPFAGMLPDGFTTASYSQWEFFFARHFGRRLSIYIAGDEYQPEDAYRPDPAPPDDDPGLQQVFHDYIAKELGRDRTYFANVGELARAILREDWPQRRAGKPIALPYPTLGSLFKGRDAFLQDLHASLTRGPGRTAITGSALHGLGGIGKTRAAVEYAWAHEADYSALLFVIAETPEALRRNLAALAGPLVLNLPQQDEPKEDVRLKAVLDWLKLHPEWLLILDNLDTEAALDEAGTLLLGALKGGRILITSRLSNFAAQIHPLELDVLAIDDAIAFLLERTDSRRRKMPDDAETARRLADDLGGLALALEQAGAYVAKHRISFARYHELWKGNWDKVARWSDERLMNYPRAFAVTWQTSVDQLTPDGRSLLETLAWFAPEPIPNFLLDVLMPFIKGEGLEVFADALTNLADYSLVRHNPDKQEFRIHRLVQEVTRRNIAEQERRYSLTRALEWLNIAFAGDPDDVRNWSHLDPLAPHVRSIVEHADSAQITKPTADLMNNLGLLLRFKAKYTGAEAILRPALAICELSHGPDHSDVARHLISLADVLWATNRLVEAEPLLRRALAISEASHNHEDPMVAAALNNLAEFLRTTDRSNEAEPLFRRALAIFEKSYGPDHPNVARVLNNLALLLRFAARRNEAEPLFRRALAISEASFGPDHTLVAINLNNLAGLLREMNRPGEAEPLFRRALAISEASYGIDHPIVATRLNNLALLLRDTGRSNDAEPLFRRALEISEASRPDHPEVAITLNNLAKLLENTDRLNEAEPLFRRALSINKTSYGPNHPRIAIGLNNIASLLEAMNRLSEAEPMYRRALAIDEASYGPDHPNVAIRLNNLAELLRTTNRLSDAEPMYRRALAIDEASYGPDHPNVAIRLNNLAELLRTTNRLSDAEPMYRRALAIDEASYGPDHPTVAIRLNNLAELLRATNRLGKAEPLFRRALAIGEASYGPSHPNLAACLNNLAELLRTTNRLSEAEPMYGRALAIVEASYGPSHPNVAACLNNLAGLLRTANRLSEAEPMYRRGLAIHEASYGPGHPDVAIGLNNLAGLLRATSRLSEAEPMYRRCLVILVRFTLVTGHQHPGLETGLSNYARALQELGRTETEMSAALNSIVEEAREPPAMTPAVSVIMPVHNGAAWLAESVASIQAQDFADFEFLIVDDGSDDGTAAMLAAFAAADPRIRVLRQPPQGIVAALNTAIAQARAPYLARLDADDLARPGRLGRQVAFMEAHPEIGHVGTWAEVIDGDGARVGRLTPPTGPAALARVLARTNPFVHSSVMMRTALVRRLGGYRAAFRAAEDYDLWLRMAEAGGIANLAEDLVQYRRHAASQSQRDAVRQEFSVRLARRSARARRRGAADPAAALTAPPDWWAKDAATALSVDDVGLYRFLDLDGVQGPRYIGAVTSRLFRLSHAERRLAQQRLRTMLRETRPSGWRRVGIIMLIVALHPGRALQFAWEGVVAQSRGRRPGP